MRDIALDVATVVARIEQIDREQRPEHWLWDRVITCDVPRLRAHLTPAMCAELDQLAPATTPPGDGG